MDEFIYPQDKNLLNFCAFLDKSNNPHSFDYDLTN